MLATVKIVIGYDWQGMFVNDTLFTEGHNIYLVEALHSLVGYQISSVDIFDLKEGEELDDFGNSFPVDFNELKNYLDE